MTKLALLCLVVASACTTTSGGGGGGGGGGGSGSGSGGGDVAHITAHWDIKQVNGTSLNCPPAYDTAALYSQEVDANYNNVGAPVIDLFDCNAFTGETSALPPSTFYSWVAIETHNGASTYASTVSAYVDLTVSDKTFSADIYDDGGYFQLAWTLVGGSSGTPLHCSDVTDIHGVEAVSTMTANSSQVIVDKFNCTDHYGITSVLPEGDYTVSVDAFDANNASLGTAPPTGTKTIQGPNKVTNLGSLTISIDGL